MTEEAEAPPIVTEEQELQAAKDYLWTLFTIQFSVGWSNPFPRNSSPVYYLKGGKNGSPERKAEMNRRIDWLEDVGKRYSEKVRKEIARGPSMKTPD